jgi:hypothetical protein
VAFDELCICILCNPWLCCFNHRKLTVLWTDCSSQGFGYIVCQPDDNNASLQLVAQYMSRNGFDFMTLTRRGTLHPVAFRSWQTRGNEPHLHLYLGEIFAIDWAMGKCCHMLFGHCFIGSRTVALLDFSSHTTAAIRQSSVSKCMLWDGTLTSSIGKTTIWLTPTIG